MFTRLTTACLIVSSAPGIAHAQSPYGPSATAGPLLVIFALALFIGAAIAHALAGGGKKPCTCRECRPDLYPETIEQLALRASYERGLAEVARSKQVREQEEAHLAEQREFFKTNGLKK